MAYKRVVERQRDWPVPYWRSLVGRYACLHMPTQFQTWCSDPCDKVQFKVTVYVSEGAFADALYEVVRKAGVQEGAIGALIPLLVTTFYHSQRFGRFWWSYTLDVRIDYYPRWCWNQKRWVYPHFRNQMYLMREDWMGRWTQLEREKDNPFAWYHHVLKAKADPYRITALQMVDWLKTAIDKVLRDCYALVRQAVWVMETRIPVLVEDDLFPIEHRRRWDRAWWNR